MREHEESDPQLSPEEVASALRQLALVDKVLGLEAEVARLSTRETAPDARQQIESLTHQLESVHLSMTWRVGRTILAPVQFFRRAQ